MRIYLYLFLYVFAFSSNAQQWDWAKNIDKGAEEIGTSIGVDNQNNLYVIGSTSYYTGGGGSYYYPLFYKFTSSGNLIWMDTLAFPCEKSATDSIGNTYVANGSMIAKYDNSGQKLWVQNVPTIFFKDITLSSSSGFVAVGSVYVGSNNRSAIYAFDSNGNILWNRIGDFAAGGSRPNSINCDNGGNTYWVGEDVINHTLSGFLAKIDLAGNLTYTKAIPGLPTNVVVAKDLSIYVDGLYNINSLNSPVYITKYDQQGNFLWLKLIAGDVASSNTAIATDKNNNLYLTGSYTSFQIDNKSLISNTEEVFVLMADSNANIQWIEHSTGSSQSTAYTRDVLVNQANDIFIIGGASRTHSFGTTVLNCDLYPDMLFAKIGQSITAISPITAAKNESELHVFPNPASHSIAINFSSSVKGNLILNITNQLGQTVYSENKKDFSGEYANTIDLKNQPAGIYFVKILAGTRSATRKIVLK